MSTSSKHHRPALRFSPDPNTLVWIQDDLNENSEFKLGVVGVVVNESQTGFNAVFPVSDRIVEGTPYRVAVGDLPPAIAEVRWIRVLEDSVIRAGFEYTHI